MSAGLDVPVLSPTVELPAPGLSLAAFIAALQGTTVDTCGGFPAGQCTALACAWCRNLGLGTPCGSCSAPGHCDGLCWQGSGYAGWTWIPYAPGRVPSPGDLICFHPCAQDGIGPSGHVGIFVSGDATSFTGFDQNWSGPTCTLHTHTYACVVGWQHPTSVGPPPPPPGRIMEFVTSPLGVLLIVGGAGVVAWSQMRKHPGSAGGFVEPVSEHVQRVAQRALGPYRGFTRERAPYGSGDWAVGHSLGARWHLVRDHRGYERSPTACGRSIVISDSLQPWEREPADDACPACRRIWEGSHG